MIAAIYISGVVVSLYTSVCVVNGMRNAWHVVNHCDYYDSYPQHKLDRAIFYTNCIFSWISFISLLIVYWDKQVHSFFKPFYKYGKK